MQSDPGFHSCNMIVNLLGKDEQISGDAAADVVTVGIVAEEVLYRTGTLEIAGCNTLAVCAVEDNLAQGMMAEGSLAQKVGENRIGGVNIVE